MSIVLANSAYSRGFFGAIRDGIWVKYAKVEKMFYFINQLSSFCIVYVLITAYLFLEDYTGFSEVNLSVVTLSRAYLMGLLVTVYITVLTLTFKIL